jgi:hypothetical protein
VIDRSSQDAGRGQGDHRQGRRGHRVRAPGQETWPTSAAALRWGGRVVVCGASTGFEAVTDLRFL